MEDKALWLSVWAAWPQHEPFAHPGYVRLFARQHDRALCAFMQTEVGTVLYPFILRPLAAEEWAEPTCAAVDLVGPYGYGGPYAWGSPHSASFWDELDEWACDTHVVSSFVRLSLFSEQMIPFEGQIEVKALNVVRSLDLGPEEIWMDYEHKVRKNVKRARRDGLEVIADTDGQHLCEFLDVYYSTMARRNAARRYYFPRQFFEQLMLDLAGHFVFFHAILGGRVVSSELVLCSAQYLYSFLGGTFVDALASRPNDLLKHQVVEWGHEHGMKAFVLGGGYQEADGILRYKLSFAPRGAIQFKVGMRIHDSAIYSELINRRSRWEAAKGRTWTPDPGYFPGYRA